MEMLVGAFFPIRNLLLQNLGFIFTSWDLNNICSEIEKQAFDLRCFKRPTPPVGPVFPGPIRTNYPRWES